MPLAPGMRLGAFEIVAPVGAGGMGEVYRALDSRLHRAVAIKVLPDYVSSDPERLRRFEQEAKAAAALNHPNILAVYHMETQESIPYLVTELLEGQTLRETLRSGLLPLRKAIDYGAQIAHGLAAAHEKGIVHRDLKPENLFVTRDGKVKILDFGLAKLTPPAGAPAGLALTLPLNTEPGRLMGTVGYVSPEQLRGQDADNRSDIFAFGAIFYEMLTGMQTFRRPTSADTMSASLHEEPTAIAQLVPSAPAALQRVVHRCLEKSPERRFQSASDLAFALEALSDPALSMSGPRTEVRPHGRIRPRVAAAVTAAALGVAAVAWLLLRPPAVPTVANYVQLTHDGQRKSLIGTDGSRLYLALASSVSSASQGIAEMSAAGGEAKRLAIAPSNDMIPVDLSADGSELLVVDGQGAPPKGPLWSLPVVGGSPRRLGEVIAETAAWSPDGKLLAYAVHGELFLAKADGTDPRKLVSIKGDIKNIVWSPDSARLRFDTAETAGGFGQQAFWEVSTGGADLHRVLAGWHDPPNECCGKWTADGKYFVFESNRQLWALPQKRIFQSEPTPIQLTSSPLPLSSPLPSKDGKRLFFAGQTYRGELMRYDSKSGRFAQYLGGISGEYASFSKDGQWVAYVSYPQGNLWRSKADGSERMQLTYPPLYAMLPRWSPDGKKIVFFEFESSSGKSASMYEVSPEGGSPRRLLAEDQHSHKDPNWSPDGDRIVFGGEANDPAAAIFVFDVASRRISTLPRSQGLFSPRWSPDRRYILACSADSMKLLVFDFQTEKWSEMGQGPLGWPSWSKDGQYVYYMDYRGNGAVLRIRVNDHKVERLIDLKDFTTAGRYDGSLTLAPDDSPLLLRYAGTQDIYALDWKMP